MVDLIKGFVVNFKLSMNGNLIVGTTFRLINGHDLNYNKLESHLSLKVFYYLITAEHAPSESKLLVIKAVSQLFDRP